MRAFSVMVISCAWCGLEGCVPPDASAASPSRSPMLRTIVENIETDTDTTTVVKTFTYDGERLASVDTQSTWGAQHYTYAWTCVWHDGHLTQVNESGEQHTDPNPLISTELTWRGEKLIETNMTSNGYGNASFAFTYNADDRLAGYVTQSRVGPVTGVYAYDDDGLVSTSATQSFDASFGGLPDQSTAIKFHRTDGRLSSLEWSASGVESEIFTVELDVDQRVTRIASANGGVVLTYTYNGDGQLASVRKTFGGSTTVTTNEYTYEEGETTAIVLTPAAVFSLFPSDFENKNIALMLGLTGRSTAEALENTTEIPRLAFDFW